MAKINGATKWISLGLFILTMVVAFFVRAALLEERLDVMDTRHNTAIEAVKETHGKDIGYVREDLKTIKDDVKKILEKL